MMFVVTILLPTSTSPLLHLSSRTPQLEHTSWLLSWWNRVGYFRYREPSVVNSNYFLRFDTGVPRSIG